MHPFALQHTNIAKKTILNISNGRDIDWKSPRLPRPWNGQYVALEVMSLGHTLLEANAHFETTPTPVKKYRAEESGLPGRCHFAADEFSRMRTRHLCSPHQCAPVHVIFITITLSVKAGHRWGARGSIIELLSLYLQSNTQRTFIFTYRKANTSKKNGRPSSATQESHSTF
jgi:hypothetical protein